MDFVAPCVGVHPGRAGARWNCGWHRVWCARALESSRHSSSGPNALPSTEHEDVRPFFVSHGRPGYRIPSSPPPSMRSAQRHWYYSRWSWPRNTLSKSPVRRNNLSHAESLLRRGPSRDNSTPRRGTSVFHLSIITSDTTLDQSSDAAVQVLVPVLSL